MSSFERGDRNLLRLRAGFAGVYRYGHRIWKRQKNELLPRLNYTCRVCVEDGDRDSEPRTVCDNVEVA